MATELLAESLVNFINIYLALIIIRVLLSWFQTTGWGQQALSYVSPVTDPYLNIFRQVIPPLGGIDLSPILAIFSLQIVAQLLAGIV